jgi:uncharacterized lipoprotein YddW (UPF0748 family)
MGKLSAECLEGLYRKSGSVFGGFRDRRHETLDTPKRGCGKMTAVQNDFRGKSSVNFVILWLLAVCLSGEAVVPAWARAAEAARPQTIAERRGLFVTVIADPPVLSDRREIEKLVDFARQKDIKILFVQIYRANRAWFPSRMADTSPYENSRKSVGEDAFRLLIRQAHAAGIEVHAWLNLLSLADNKSAPILRKYGAEILTKNTEPKAVPEDYRIDKQYFLEPGDPRVREELDGMVGEILRAYPELDGIQFDYIRYPDERPAYGHTKINLERFRERYPGETPDEGNPVWRQWKREQVTGLLEGLVEKTRLLRPDILISATACTSYTRAYHEAFQDWPSWIRRELVDFVTLMNYSPHFSEYAKDIVEARDKTWDFRKVKIGIGAYKLGKYPGRFAKMFRLCEKAGGGGCAVFHYGSMVENPALCAAMSEGRQRSA